MFSDSEQVVTGSTGKLLLIIICLIFVAHISFFIYYTQHNKRSEAKVNHDIMVQQVLNLIERINFTSPIAREKVASAVDIPNVSISIDPTPKWKIQLKKGTSLWIVNKKIAEQRAAIKVSLQLSAHHWLNISANILSTSWWLQILLLVLELVVAAAVIFSIWSINRFSKPLKQFRKAADRLGIDMTPQPLAEYGPALVKETAQAMNNMQKRIADLIKERTQMLAALSHDLRTPITRMKLRAQFINDPEQYQKTIKDLDDMEAMISETLAFAKNKSRLENMVKLDLSSILTSITNDFVDMGHDVVYHNADKRLLLQGRSVALKRAFTNLVENAIKYAGQAEISTHIYANEVVVNIDDNGPGLAEEQLEKVFAPFYRVEDSRSRDTGGTGLGLAVTRDIIRAHGGSIVMKNRQVGGLRAQVRLPV